MSGTIYAGTGAVGFELVIPCSGEPLNSRVHENDGSLTVFLIFVIIVPFLRIPRHCACRGERIHFLASQPKDVFTTIFQGF